MTSPFLVSRTSGSIHPTALSSSWMKLSGSRPGLMEMRIDPSFPGLLPSPKSVRVANLISPRGVLFP